jgi:hypothetical protein
MDPTPEQIRQLIDRINEEAEQQLKERRRSLPPNRDGWWRGKPNPYAVGYAGKNDAWDW